jgi:hypothetical protein
MVDSAKTAIVLVPTPLLPFLMRSMCLLPILAHISAEPADGTEPDAELVDRGRGGNSHTDLTIHKWLIGVQCRAVEEGEAALRGDYTGGA